MKIIRSKIQNGWALIGNRRQEVVDVVERRELCGEIGAGGSCD
jgi:hypothetical protein